MSVYGFMNGGFFFFLYKVFYKIMYFKYVFGLG